MGIGGAFIMPATLSIITAVFTDPAERTKAIGLWSAVSGLGVAIGPVAGGWLLAHFSWDSIFLVNLPIVAVALVAGRWLIPASRTPRSGRLDLTGAVLSVAAFTIMTYTIIEAPGNGWLSATTLGLAAASVALLAAFVVWEARSDHPMLPLHLFRNRRFTGAGLTITVLFFALSGVVYGHGHRLRRYRPGHVGRDVRVHAGAAAGHGRGGFGGQRHHPQHGQRARRGRDRQHHRIGVRQPDGAPGARDHGARRGSGSS